MSGIPTISVGLPVAQEPVAYVRDAVHSVLNQSFEDWELIVVADGAPAQTLAFLDEIADARVKIVVHTESRGLATRLNEIAGLARGAYIARMDADDIMMTDRLERQLEVMRQHDVELVAGQAVIIDESSRIVGQSGPAETTVSRGSMIRSTPFIHPTVFASAEWFRRHPYDAALLRCQDKALWITSFSDTRHYRDAAPVLFYRMPANLNPDKYSRSARFERKIIRTYGPAVIGQLRTSLVLAESLIKQSIIRISSRSGWTHLVTRRRFDEVDATTRSAWEDTLRASTIMAEAEHDTASGKEGQE